MTYTLYFAYGSNMDEEQFRERCRNSFVLCRAVLADHRFVITSRGYANVLRRPGATVHGVLCALTREDEAVLDDREGVPRGVYRKDSLTVTTELGYAIPALIYIDRAEEEGHPKPGYLERILRGARRHGLPEAAIAEIGTWAGGV